MTDRYPGYDVLAKRQTESWNEATRQVIDRRLAMPREPRFFSAAEWRTLNAIIGSCRSRRIVLPCRCRPLSTRRWRMSFLTATAMPNCRRKVKLGAGVWPRLSKPLRRRTTPTSRSLARRAAG
jgi:hypothetical protein